ncbi:MAG TPA: 4-alpha-glucanotransferase, partial [Rhizomicrobium sp.]|nr:4-alpha-glucanotransferase [Rhizomicrobium sp.]
MSDAGIANLARSAGLEIEWTDAGGKSRHVPPEVLRAVLEGLTLPAGNASTIRDSLGRLKEERAKPAPLEIVRPGAKIRTAARHLCLSDEAGGRIILEGSDGIVVAPRRPGYYAITDSDRRMAVVPARAFCPHIEKTWGIGVQLYALPGGTTKGFGDFAALAGFAEKSAALGADAVAISPVHALFAARPVHISPYAPSTRLFLNPLYAPLDHPAVPDRGRSVDWRRAAGEKWRALRMAFAEFADQKNKSAFEAFVRQGGPRLLNHARFEVLDARFRAGGLADWREWPKEYRDHQSGAVREMGPDDPEMAFQLFLQWVAERGLEAAQARAKRAGMRIGLITDMAVGMDPGGSHAWSAPEEIL